MRRIKLQIVAAAVIAMLAATGPSQAGTEVTLRVPVVRNLKFSVGLRVDTKSISLDGILFLEEDNEQKKRSARVGTPSKRSVHKMQFGVFPNFFTTAHKCYVAVRALQQTTSRITKHRIAGEIRQRNKPKGSEDADSR